MHRATPATIALLAAVVCASAWAQKPSVYPAKGQSPEQKSTDDGQCLAWAKQDTGIDPAVVASTQPPPPQPQGERLRGAARGAIVGEIVDDKAGEGAALGALAGGRHARMNQAGQAQQAQAQKQQTLDTYYRAYGACMQGRGYTIS
jgi:hypothetical protein